MTPKFGLHVVYVILVLKPKINSILFHFYMCSVWLQVSRGGLHTHTAAQHNLLFEYFIPCTL